MDIRKEIQRETLHKLLSMGRRADGRGKLDYREFGVEKGVLKNAEGSALAHIGKTQILCGVKFDIATPYPDRPEEGILSTGAELTPLGSPIFEPGPPSETAIELARVTDRGIRSSETIDMGNFFIEDGKVLALYIDLYVLDHDGNMFDASALAAMAALQDAKMPKIEDAKIIRGESTGQLKLSKTVVSSTFAKVGNDHLLDPAFEEEMGSDGTLTIATTEEHMCAAQKAGWASYSKKDIMELLDISFKKGEELRRSLKKSG